MSRTAYWCLAVVLGLGLNGCQTRKPGTYRIVVIPKGLTHEHWQSVYRGALRAADDLGKQGVPTEIIWDGPLRERDALAQIRIIDRRVSTRVDGIVLAPQHSQTMVAPVKRAGAEGIPVVVIDSGLESPDLFVKYVATDNFHGGYLAAQQLIRVLRAEGRTHPKLILLRYAVGSESTEKREAGFEKYIDEEVQAGRLQVTWLSRDKYAGATKDSALKEAAPLVNRFRDQIDGIFTPNESSASGMLDALRSLGLSQRVRRNGEPTDALRQAVQAGLVGAEILTDGAAEATPPLLRDETRLKSLGLTKAVHLMGFDSSAPLLNAVADGEVDGLILQDPYLMGYLSVWVLVRHLQGDDVSSGGKELGTGEHVITRANLDLPTTIELFNPEAQSKRTIAVPIFPKRP